MRRCITVCALFLTVLFLYSKGHSLTLSQAETEVRRLVKDTATSSTLQRYSDSLLDDFLNQSQREVVNATWCLQKSTTIVLTSQTTYYDLPSDLIVPKLVRFKNQSNLTTNLEEKSYKSIQESNPDYEKQSGPPTQYFVRYSTQAEMPYEAAFIPVPTTSSTGTVTLDYYKQATDLLSDSDVLLDGFLILVPYHEAVIYQTVSKIKLIEGDTAGAGAYLQLYQGALQSMISRLGDRPNYNPGLSAGGSGFTGSPSR